MLSEQVDATAAGFDPARLSRIEDHLVSRYIEPGKIAGAQVAIWRGDVLAYRLDAGHADIERGRTFADDTIVRLYSMTKPVTGVALLQLYEQGHFQLDDPVRRWIPEWRDMTVRHGAGTVPAEREPTVRHVMMHMAGIGYGPENGELNPLAISGGGASTGDDSGSGALTLETLGQRLGGWPLRFQPGTQWLYSFGMDVCARLVEVMSGQSYDEYLAEHVFGPLGMVDTAFSVPDDKVDRFAACYRRNSRKELKLLDDPETSPYRKHPSFLSGGGGLVGTIADYLRFARMLLDGGALDGTRLLSRKTVELMSTNHLPGNKTMADYALPGGYGEVGFEGQGFGLTVSVSQGPAATGVAGSVGEFMWGGAAATTFWVDPAEDLTCVFMTQLLPPGLFNFRGQLKSLVYGALDD